MWNSKQHALEALESNTKAANAFWFSGWKLEEVAKKMYINGWSVDSALIELGVL